VLPAEAAAAAEAEAETAHVEAESVIAEVLTEGEPEVPEAADETLPETELPEEPSSETDT